MPIDDNVFISGSDGETCIVCEKKIPHGELCLKVRFNVNVLGITKKKMVEAMHYDCAGTLYYLLGQRIAEATKMISGRR